MLRVPFVFYLGSFRIDCCYLTRILNTLRFPRTSAEPPRRYAEATEKVNAIKYR